MNERGPRERMGIVWGNLYACFRLVDHLSYNERWLSLDIDADLYWGLCLCCVRVSLSHVHTVVEKAIYIFFVLYPGKFVYS